VTTEFPSVVVSVTVNDPAEEYEWLAGLPEPVELSPKFQANEYGAVPPVADAVNVTGVPTVGEGLTVKLVDKARGATMTTCVEIVV